MIGGIVLKKEVKADGNLKSKNKNSVNLNSESDIEIEESADINENSSADNQEDLIVEYELKLKESGERFLRLQADFENFRKRVVKEREEIYLLSLEELMTQLLTVIDNFDRALDSFKAGDLDAKYIEGLEMVYNNFLEILNKNGIKEIDAENCVFDPNYHHAVMQEETDDDDNVIKEIFQKGYMLNSKVIRPCMVKVAVKN